MPEVARTRLGVLGWPVAHSRSPVMHRAALRELGLTAWTYQLLPAPPEVFRETALALGAAGFRGANVTIPHKEAALALAHEATGPARAIGAANTLTFRDDGTVHADNTDAPGFLAALPAPPAPGSRALVLGAGGSARAVVWALVQAGVQVALWNRTADRARAVAGDLGARAVTGAVPADLLVNCTSVGLENSSTPFKGLPLGADEIPTYATVADLVYRPEETPFLSAARRGGCAVADGLEVLVRQGALSLEAWTGLPAPVDVMRRAVRGGSTEQSL